MGRIRDEARTAELQLIRTLDDADAEEASQQPPRLRLRRRCLLSAAAGSASLVLIWAALAMRHAQYVAPSARLRSDVTQPEDKSEVSKDTCAMDYRDNCQNRTCCNEFTTCYEKQPGVGKCRPACALGAPESAPPWLPDADLVPWTCKVIGKEQAPPSWKETEDASPSLFCYAVTLVRGNEPELLRRQLATGSGVFGCNEYALFSERQMLLGPGPSGKMVKTVEIGGPMASSRNNTWDFMRAWKKVIEHGRYRHHAWTVKIDPDSVFIASRLRLLLSEHNIEVTSRKVYFRNCKHWKSIQGPLEILSQGAAVAFFSSIDDCKKQPGIVDHGEDWFIGHCMDMLHFEDLEDWGLLDDQYCSGTRSRRPCEKGMAAYHPFKTVESFAKCLEDVS